MIFTAVITVDEQECLFLFQLKEVPDALKFFVSASSPFIYRISFEAKREFGIWKVVPPVPEWIQKVEEELFDLLRTKIPYQPKKRSVI